MYVDFLNRNIDIEIIYKQRRSIGIQVLGYSSLRIITYKELTEAEILDMLNHHKRFLINHLNNKSEAKAKDKLHLLGLEYDLNIIEADFNNVIVDSFSNQIKVYVKKKADPYIKAVIDDYYNNVLRDIVYKNEAIIKEKMNIKFNVTYDYKNVKTYFGECYKSRRYIILNTKLAKYELNLILSVIYHEYAHFYYSGHGVKFYNLLEGVFKNYKATQAKLRRVKYNDFY